MPFDEVLRLALYDASHGFYTTGGFAGRRGDFLTSPEVGPLFGHLVAEAIDREWDRLGQPSVFTVVDAGAGPGTLARSVHAAEPRCRDALDYVAVEISADQRAKHPEWVTSMAEIPTGICGVVIANELLDNLPFVPVERYGGHLRPAFVEVSSDVLSCTFADRGRQVDDLAFSSTVDAGIWQPEVTQWVGHVLGSVIERGRLIVVDYCRTNSSEVEIRTYAEHGRAGDPLVALGSKDVTVDVDLEQLQRTIRTADAQSSQNEWLTELGIDRLVDEGRSVWEVSATVGDLEALRARSRIRESEALLDPGGLGGFTVAQWVVD